MLSKVKLLKRLFQPAYLMPLFLLVIIAAVGGYIYVRHFHRSHSPTTIVTAGTPVPAPKVPANNVRPKTSTNASNSLSSNAGGATDTHGNASSSTNSSQWTTSASGSITVKHPAANSKISDGTVISGSAKVDQINYRLSDNVVGVIAQGTLNVVNGDFSGILHFTPKGTGGRLDIFSTNEMGVEFNEVQINVSF